ACCRRSSLSRSAGVAPTARVELFNAPASGPPPIMALLLDSGIMAKLDEVIGFDRLEYDGGQIALRKAGNASEPFPPQPHIKSIWSPSRGTRPDPVVGAGGRALRSRPRRPPPELSFSGPTRCEKSSGTVPTYPCSTSAHVAAGPSSRRCHSAENG